MGFNDLTSVILTTPANDGYVALDNITYTAAVSAAPEPGTWALMVLGVGAIGAAGRRRQGRYQIAAA